MRVPFFLLFLSILAMSSRVTAQSGPDTTHASTSVPDTVVADPAEHRVLWMSTGRTMAKGSGSFGIFELCVLQGGYAPTDFLQLNASFTPLAGMYGSLGAKVQLLPPSGFFRGLALGADVGHFAQTYFGGAGGGFLLTYNIATSLGSEEAQLHLSATGVGEWESETFTAPIIWQTGATVRITEGRDHQDKLMAEVIWGLTDRGKVELLTGIAGFRHTNGRFTWELGMIMTPAINFGGHGSQTRYPLPYLSGVWYFNRGPGEKK